MRLFGPAVEDPETETVKRTDPDSPISSAALFVKVSAAIE